MPKPLFKPDPGELVVLSLLGEGALYGYAITKAVAARSDDQMRLPPSLLYPLLARMETQGLISSSWDEVRSSRSTDESPGRRRKWYKLTPKGERRLSQGIEDHRAYLAVIDRFIAPPPGEGKRA